MPFHYSLSNRIFRQTCRFLPSDGSFKQQVIICHINCFKVEKKMEDIIVLTAFMFIMYNGFNNACKTLHNLQKHSWHRLMDNSVTKDKMIVQDGLNHLLAKANSGIFCIFLKLINFYFWLCWVFVSVRGLSLVAASGGHSSSRCVGLSLSQPLFLRSTGSRRTGSAVAAHRPSCSVACGILPDQGSNPCPLHWQADSQPLCHQGSPLLYFIPWRF